jgi:hypothetical protein
MESSWSDADMKSRLRKRMISEVPDGCKKEIESLAAYRLGCRAMLSARA